MGVEPIAEFDILINSLKFLLILLLLKAILTSHKKIKPFQ